MAIIYCAKCGERFDSSLPKCPTCGWIPQGFNNNAAFGVKNSEDEPNESGSDNPKNPFGGQDGNDRNNPNGYGQGSQGGYNPNGYGQNGYNYSYDYNPAPQSKRSLNKGSLVFSIITLLIGIVSIGAFFGGASLLLTIFAQNSKTDEDEKAKIKTAGILNVIGIVFGVLFLITYVMIFLYDVK